MLLYVLRSRVQFNFQRPHYLHSLHVVSHQSICERIVSADVDLSIRGITILAVMVVVFF
jgi:hypothetical protein